MHSPQIANAANRCFVRYIRLFFRVLICSINFFSGPSMGLEMYIRFRLLEYCASGKKIIKVVRAALRTPAVGWSR